MAIAVVNRNTGLDVNGAVGHATATFPSNTAGNLLCVMALVSGSSLTSITISDTAGNTWVQIVSQANLGGSFSSIRAWVCYNCNASAGTNTVTVNDGGTGLSIGIYEASGLATSSAFDKSAFAKNTSSTTPSSGATAVTTFANELVLAGSLDNGSTLGTYTAGTGYSNAQVPTASNSLITAFEEKIISAAAAQTGIFNLSATNGFELTMVLTFADTPVPAPSGSVIPLRRVNQAVNRAASF